MILVLHFSFHVVFVCLFVVQVGALLIILEFWKFFSLRCYGWNWTFSFPSPIFFLAVFPGEI